MSIIVYPGLDVEEIWKIAWGKRQKEGLRLFNYEKRQNEAVCGRSEQQALPIGSVANLS